MIILKSGLKLLPLLYTLLNHTAVDAQPTTLSDEAAAKVVQDAMACYTVSVAAKILQNKNGKWNKNILFSPVSLYHANAVALLGSAGPSKKKLKRVLGISDPKYNVHDRRRRQSDAGLSLVDIYSTIGELVYNTEKGIKKSASNSSTGVFVHNEFAIKSTFIEDARDYLKTEVMCTDFKRQNKASTDLINRWVAKKTNKQITDFYEEPVSKDTKLVISSSMYVNAAWDAKPRPDSNPRSIFSGRDDGCENSQVSLMTNAQNIPYTRLENMKVEAIAIPFKDPKLVLYIVLPFETVPVASIVSKPNKNLLLEIIESAKPQMVKYAIPKMKFSDEIDQLELFKQDGFKNITEDEIADKLMLTNMKQKVKIDINENGIGKPANKADQNPSPGIPTVQFIVNRPYLFFLYNNLMKTFLYYGMVLKPEGYDD